jgi:lipid-A-disaccharide synthase
MDKPLKIALVAGEASGDRQGAALVEAVRERIAPRPLHAWGTGGHHMRDAGVEIRHDCSPWGSIGIAATAAAIPQLLSMMGDLKRALQEDPPDALVLIDAGAFNMRLGRWVKQHNICPLFYYFPPGSWRRAPRSSNGKRRIAMADVADRVVTPFPWSAEFLARGGVDVHFVGHPLLDLVQPTVSDRDFYERFGLDPKRPLVALMPGSRRMEIEHILPAMVGAAGEISRRVVGVQFALVLAPTVSREQVETIIRREQRAAARQIQVRTPGKLALIAQSTLGPPVVPQLATAEGVTMPAPTEAETSAARDRSKEPAYAPLVICEDSTYDVISRSDLVITKSGTSTLEAAILKKPMIIVYRGSALMKFEWFLRKSSLNISYIGLPNILAQEEIFPELIQDEASPEAISEIAVDILLQPERLLTLKTKISDVVHETLGEPGGVGRAADLLIETAAHQRQTTEARG